MESQTSICVSLLLRCDLPNGRRAHGRLSTRVESAGFDQIKDKQHGLLFLHAAECSDAEIQRADQLREACLAKGELCQL